MDEDFVGLVGDCDNRLVIVPPDSFAALQKASSEQQTMACCGVRFAAGAEDQAGRLVAELRVGSVLDRAGVEPGDRLTGVNGNAISSDDSLRLLLQAPLLKIEVVRAGRLMTLQYEAVSSGSGAAFERSPSGVRVLSVTAETVAEQSGLKPGDIVVRVGGVNRPLPAAVDKALTTPGGTQIVVLRGDRRMLLGVAQ
jgi:S1-C subfamily serine protease